MRLTRLTRVMSHVLHVTFYCILAADHWQRVPRAAKYGVGDFNVAHVADAALDALLRRVLCPAGDTADTASAAHGPLLLSTSAAQAACAQWALQSVFVVANVVAAVAAAAVAACRCDRTVLPLLAVAQVIVPRGMCVSIRSSDTSKSQSVVVVVARACVCVFV